MKTTADRIREQAQDLFDLASRYALLADEAERLGITAEVSRLTREAADLCFQSRKITHEADALDEFAEERKS